MSGRSLGDGFIESFNARLRDELLDGEILYYLSEAKVVIEIRLRYYNTERPHGSLGYNPPAPEVIPAFAARAALQPRSATPPELAERPTDEVASPWTNLWGPTSALNDNNIARSDELSGSLTGQRCSRVSLVHHGTGTI